MGWLGLRAPVHPCPGWLLLTNLLSGSLTIHDVSPFTAYCSYLIHTSYIQSSSHPTLYITIVFAFTCTFHDYQTYPNSGPFGRMRDTFDLNKLFSTMENPHAERQAVLLERILKNAVKKFLFYYPRRTTNPSSVEMYRNDFRAQSLC